jgi:serine phosphatase RsbU (regulator of sigma subunit)
MTIAAPESPALEGERMACMEVWGGNEVIDTSIRMPGLDAWIYAKPYKRAEFGGDVHYLSTCATGRITRLLLADVSGHGEEVNGVARVLRDLMRQFVNYLEQTKFVRMMNEKFTSLSESHVFATAVVATFFSPTMEFTLCNAGHPPPILYKARTYAWSLIENPVPSEGEDPVNIPLGILDIAEYGQVNLKLEPGDMVLMYTDSLMEASDANGSLLGPKGVLNLVRSLTVIPGSLDPASLISKLLLSISSLAPGNLHEDDVTAMLVQANGAARTVSLANKLLTPFRVMGGIVGSLVKGKAMPLPEMSVRNVGGAFIGRLSRR